jgi:hypothetical protein
VPFSGALIEGMDETPRILEIKSYPIVARETCINLHGYFSHFISQDSLCVNRGKNLVKWGDVFPGQGLMFMESGKWSIRGIVSNLIHKADSGDDYVDDYVDYLLHVDVANHVDWIKENMI